MQAMNKMKNVRLLKVWSSDCERRNQLGEGQKRIILKRIVEPVTEMCNTTIVIKLKRNDQRVWKAGVITECLHRYVYVETKWH